MSQQKTRLLSVLGPGILVAATGVGAGDLATAAFTGNKLGLAILWAVIAGALIKYILNEGLARWQLVTGDTLLEGAVLHLGRPVLWIFLVYLLIWSFFVAAVLMSACGVAAHAICPVFGTAAQDKVFYGLLHSVLAILLIKLGGYRLFSKVMSVCIAIMFIVVVTTAIALAPAWSRVLSGLVLPRIPQIEGEGIPWTVGLMGGIGGTVTVLCYGYWIREEGRESAEALRACRIDLAVGYGMTALFGLAMVVIGHQIGPVQGKGAGLIANIANVLKSQLGPLGPGLRWAFLIGAWGAVFSSLLGVWQSVPYLFADVWLQMRHPRNAGCSDRPSVNTRSGAYQCYLYALALVPAIGLCLIGFEPVVKWYSVIGALFIPMLALTLLVLNGRSQWITRQHRNSPLTTLMLAASLVFFLFVGGLVIYNRFWG
jgi:Mn2+/Fe2+ NRAMP family transporter